MLPYEDLPISARIKDHLLIVVTIGVAAHLGLPITKEVRLTYVKYGAYAA
jgi:hypothetical protein